MKTIIEQVAGIAFGMGMTGLVVLFGFWLCGADGGRFVRRITVISWVFAVLLFFVWRWVR